MPSALALHRGESAVRRGKHVNVLQHLMGFLKNHLSSDDKAYRR